MNAGHALRAAAGSLAGAALLVLVAAAPALAQPEGRIASVQPAGNGLEIVFTATDLPAGASLDPASVQVSIDGTSLPSTAEPITQPQYHRGALRHADNGHQWLDEGRTS